MSIPLRSTERLLLAARAGRTIDKLTEVNFNEIVNVIMRRHR
jgi:hypothetical protein